MKNLMHFTEKNLAGIHDCNRYCYSVPLLRFKFSLNKFKANVLNMIYFCFCALLEMTALILPCFNLIRLKHKPFFKLYMYIVFFPMIWLTVLWLVSCFLLDKCILF